MWLRGSHSSDGETDEEDSSARRDPDPVLGAGPRPIGPDGRLDGQRHVVRQVQEDGSFQEDDGLQEDDEFRQNAFQNALNQNDAVAQLDVMEGRRIFGPSY